MWRAVKCNNQVYVYREEEAVSCNFFMEPCVVVSYGTIFVKIQHSDSVCDI